MAGRQIRRGTAAQRIALGGLSVGEFGFETDTRRFYIGSSVGDIRAHGNYITPEMCGVVDGVDDDVQIQQAIAAARSSQAYVALEGKIYALGSPLVLDDGVWIQGIPHGFVRNGIPALTPIFSGGTILTGDGITAFSGNNFNGGGIEDIAISGINGFSLGKANQFGPQFWEINRVSILNPPSFGFRCFNFEEVTCSRMNVFCYGMGTIPTDWVGIDLVNENDEGNAVTLNHATGIFTVTAHTATGYEAGDIVYLQGGTAPTVTSGAPFALLVPYYVRDVSGPTYRLARTSGGAPISFSDDGAALVIGCCNLQPGNSVFTEPYVLWNYGESDARSLRGIQCRIEYPTYGGVEHQALDFNYMQFIRPQVNMFGFGGVLAGSDRINMNIEGHAASGPLHAAWCNGFNVSGGDFEGRAQNAINCKYLYGAYVDLAGVTAGDNAATIKMENCLYGELHGTPNATLALDVSSSNRTMGYRTFKGLAAGFDYWPMGSYYSLDDGGIIHQWSQSGHQIYKTGTGVGRIITGRLQTVLTPQTITGAVTLGANDPPMLYVAPAAGGAAINIDLEAPATIPGARRLFRMTGHAFDATLRTIAGGNLVMDAVGEACEVQSDGLAWNTVWKNF